jgi:hypothetical protein
MRYVQRGVLCLLAAVAVVVGAGVLLRGRAGPPGPGGADSFLLLAAPAEEERLEAELERVRGRLLAKHAVTLEWLAGRLTLREAASRLQELDAGTPERQLVLWREACPAECATDEERYDWTLLRYAGCEVRGHPEQAPTVRRRLAAEMPEHLRHLLPGAPELR